jgi:hypothetical protein
MLPIENPYRITADELPWRIEKRMGQPSGAMS